ncbi:Serine/threonine protein kinase [Parafrankia irregularis]|uniref:Serine/threonine protein kinase n=1 Tax=Parafrankia irregularis TaxID=795642 RepID=A0A0S4QHU5_9ACTN|nr:MULTISPECIES: protein kinase [Parafrankia]MBE3202991.1 protein kinase [Parafrankia sp. CH37]CUU54376.1 Serine/threonine protein kinase [Parafrankia irregularis]
MLTPLTEEDPRQVGRYRLHNRIGAGGMGTVYLGFTPASEPVAVKVAAAELSEDEEFRSRFEREVRAALRVRGGAVASVLDADTTASQPWMVTEYVEGVNLADAVRRRGRLEPHLVRGLAVGLADALVAIHAAGVVHRDLKPSNILLAWDGPKVIDFGIAQLTDSATLTRSGHVIGTLAWMAPEQMRGESAGTPADVFAWASCVTYAATGRHPFHADAPDLLAQRVQRDDPDIDGLPGYLRELVARALSKEARDRPVPASLLAALVGHEVRGVAEADRAAGSILEQTWTGPSPAFGIPEAPTPPRPGGEHRRAERPVTGGSPAGSSPQGPGPFGPPPPASAFRATSGPGVARRGPSVPGSPARPVPPGPPGPPGHPGHPGQPIQPVQPVPPIQPAQPVPRKPQVSSPLAAPPAWAGSGADGTRERWEGARPGAPDSRGSADPTFRPADPMPPGAPPDPRLWPAARGTGAFPPESRPPASPGAGYPPAGASPGAAAARPAGVRLMLAGLLEQWNLCALLSLALGILWIFGVGSVAAVVLGLVARWQLRRRRQRGSLAATVGIGLGCLGIAATAVVGALVRAIF